MKKGGLELISGHRRHDIASRLNYPVPVIIAQVDDDTARVEVVDGNLHRMDIPTSELCPRRENEDGSPCTKKPDGAAKMEQLTSPEPKKRTDQIVAEDMGISRNQVNRLVKINDLVPELKQQVDDKKLPFNTAVELAYLKPDEQTKVVDVMKKEQIVPSMAQATALKEASRHADTMQKNRPLWPPRTRSMRTRSRPLSSFRRKLSGIEGHIYRCGTEGLLSWRNAECRGSQSA